MEKPLGSNWGYPVSKYLKSVHVTTPAPWCAAFVHFCLDSAGIKTPITAYSPSAQNLKNTIYINNKWYKEPESGDVFTIYFPSMGRIGHTGFIDRKINESVCETVEGNSNNAGSREGIGVFRRKRPVHTLHSITRWTKN